MCLWVQPEGIPVYHSLLMSLEDCIHLISAMYTSNRRWPGQCCAKHCLGVMVIGCLVR